MLLKRVNNLRAQDKKRKENVPSGVPYKMEAFLEYSKIQNLICNNSITNSIMTDTYSTVHMTI